MDWMCLVQNRDQLWASLSIVMNLQVWKREKIVHVMFVTYPFYSPSQTSYFHLCCILHVLFQVYIHFVCTAGCVTGVVNFYT
jgi:hypothetical protein